MAYSGFRSAAFRSESALRLAEFEAVRRSEPWRRVVRSKGFLFFDECPGFRFTLQVRPTSAVRRPERILSLHLIGFERIHDSSCTHSMTTPQMVGERLDMRVEPCATPGETTLVFIGQRLQVACRFTLG